MPYINVNMAQTLNPAQEEALKDAIGEAITVLPGKNPAVVVLDLETGKNMYLGGKKAEDMVFIDVHFWGHSLFDDKAAFTEVLYKIFAEKVGTPENRMVINFAEYSEWATLGKLGHR